MAEPSVVCPSCNKKIPLTRALTAQIEEELRKKLETDAKKREREIENDYKRKLSAERQLAEKKAREALALELEELRQQVSEREEEVEKARQKELEFRKRLRDLEKKEQAMALEIARKVDEERKRIEAEITKRLHEESHLKDLEKEKQLADLRRQIEELKRKAEQGSQQTQGEVSEIELEELLRVNFPYDQIEPVSKGVRGADIIQRVHTTSGQFCGIIVWEIKNTKAWSDGWIPKLKEDQRSIKAEIAVLASLPLPKGVNHFANVDGIWVTDFQTVSEVAVALRLNLIQVAMTRIAAEGRSDKIEMLYSYLSGTEFKQQVEVIVESFVAMKEDLDRERRAMETAWSKRDKQIQRVIQSVSRMYGDMQGIIGGTLPKIDYLELPAPSEK